jgi:hypothetical protein
LLPQPVKEKLQIGPVRDDGIPGKPSFGKKKVEKGFQIIGKLLLFQGVAGPIAGEREKRGGPALPPGPPDYILLFMRLYLRSLRKASALLRRFFTLGFS